MERNKAMVNTSGEMVTNTSESGTIIASMAMVSMLGMMAEFMRDNG